MKIICNLEWRRIRLDMETSKGEEDEARGNNGDVIIFIVNYWTNWILIAPYHEIEIHDTSATQCHNSSCHDLVCRQLTVCNVFSYSKFIWYSLWMRPSINSVSIEAQNDIHCEWDSVSIITKYAWRMAIDFYALSWKNFLSHSIILKFLNSMSLN